MHDSHLHNLTNGLIGMAASGVAVLTTFQQELEWWIRITGGMLGILIAVITLLNFLCKFLKRQ